MASIEQKVHNSFEERKNDFATKEDIAKLEGKLSTKIAETKSEIIKWMFIFWIGQLASVIAIVKLFMK